MTIRFLLAIPLYTLSFSPPLLSEELFKQIITEDLPSKQIITEDLPSKQITTEDLSTKQIIAEDLSTKQIITEDLSTKQIITEDLPSVSNVIVLVWPVGSSDDVELVGVDDLCGGLRIGTYLGKGQILLDNFSILEIGPINAPSGYRIAVLDY